MPQENVDTFRRAWEALFSEGNPAVFRDLYDPDILLRIAPEVSPEPGTFVGAVRVEQWFQDFFSIFGSDLQAELIELIDAGDSVVSLYRLTGRGHGSGIEVA